MSVGILAIYTAVIFIVLGWLIHMQKRMDPSYKPQPGDLGCAVFWPLTLLVAFGCMFADLTMWLINKNKPAN